MVFKNVWKVRLTLEFIYGNRGRTIEWEKEFESGYELETG